MSSNIEKPIKFIPFAIHSNSNGNGFEQTADFLLLPLRFTFSGKRFVYLKNNTESYRYQKPDGYFVARFFPPEKEAEEEKLVAWKVTLKIIFLSPFLLVMTPLGLLLKAFSLISPETRAAYQNWTEIKPCSTHMNDLQNLYDTCVQKGLKEELHLEIAHHPLSYLEFSQLDNVGRYHFPPLSLSECACNKPEAFDRLSSLRRWRFEKEILAHIETTHPNKEDTVHLLSMGSGALLQEWILIGQLKKKGYHKISLTAVDPQYGEEKGLGAWLSESPKALEKFKDFFKDSPDIKIQHFSNIYEVLKQAEKVDAVLAIDYDEFVLSSALDAKHLENNKISFAALDLFKAKRFLKENGKLFLGFINSDLVLPAKGKPTFLQGGEIQKWSQLIRPQIQKWQKENSSQRPMIVQFSNDGTSYHLALALWVALQELPPITLKFKFKETQPLDLKYAHLYFCELFKANRAPSSTFLERSAESSVDFFFGASEPQDREKISQAFLIDYKKSKLRFKKLKPAGRSS